MNARTPKAVRREPPISAVTLLVEFEVPRTEAYEAFEQRLDANLAELEQRFSDFVTRNSFAGSMGR